MTHKKSLEAVNRSLKDIRDNKNIMGGVLLVLAGDFRQTLPIIPMGTPADEMYASLKRTPLWSKVTKMSLTRNMRAELSDDPNAPEFAKAILNVGNGLIPLNDENKMKITPILGNVVNSVENLIDHTFPDFASRFTDLNWLSERAILAPLNKSVDGINKIILSKIPGIYLIKFMDLKNKYLL